MAKLLRKTKVKVVFLQETKLEVLTPSVKRSLLGKNLGGIKISASRGASGGLFTIWDPIFFQLETSFELDNAIMLVGKLQQVGLRCTLVNIYAPNAYSDRKNFFELLSNHISTLNLPVIVGGDFNTTKSVDEKLGAQTYSGPGNMLVEFISRNRLIDLPHSNNKFTWFRGGDRLEASRLDRFLVSPEILNRYKNVRKCFLHSGISDHRPVILKEEKSFDGPKPFKWFNHWADELKLCRNIELEAHNDEERDIGNTLKGIKGVVKRWVQVNGSDRATTSEKLEAKIVVLEEKLFNGGHDPKVCIARAALGTGDYDRLHWIGSQSGVYSPKGFWEMATTIGSRKEDIWRLVWAKLAPPKVEAFLWKAIKGRLPVGTELLKHNIIVPWSVVSVLEMVELSTYILIPQSGFENGILWDDMDYLAMQE
ncbi:hypothetical protein GQ457_03G013320 [Hibiscus cannabinus]